MSSPDILREIKLEKYCGLLGGSRRDACGLFLCDETGTILGEYCDLAVEPIPERLQQFRLQHNDWPTNPFGIRFHDGENSWILWHQPLSTGETGALGYVVLCRPAAADEPDQGLLSEQMRVLADSLVDDYRMIAELNEMATELGERYDELNLLYSVEDQFSGNPNKVGRVMLQQLVEDCARHLGVEAVELWLKDDEQAIRNHGQQASDDPSHPAGILARLRPALYAAVRRLGRPLVVNRINDGFWTELGLQGGRGKLIAAPSFDVRRQVVGVFAVFNDLAQPDFLTTHRKVVEVLAEQASTAYQAVQDPLTGLFNRRGLEARIDSLLANAGETAPPCALLYLDIEGFKLVNDTCGYHAGDELLRLVGSLIGDEVKGHDLVGRIGSDEFGVLLGDCSVADACVVAERILDFGRDFRFRWLDKQFDQGFSIGVVGFDDKRMSASELLRAADAACQVAKQAGRHGYHVYSENDASLNRHRSELDWMQAIHLALDENRFELHAQEIRPFAANDARHYEILLRMRDEDDELVPPMAFIPVAEKYQIMSRLDRWVVEHTLAALNHYQRINPELSLHVSINLSGQSFNDKFLDFVNAQLDTCEVPLSRVSFEITETAVVSDLNRARDFIQGLRDRGCRFYLDDFGTGLSSFGYLKRLPVDYLKIDGAFVRHVAEDPVDAAMVGAIVTVARVLNLETVAEYVEDEQVLNNLRGIGVDHCQGFHIHKPRELDEEVQILAARKGLSSAVGG